MKPIKLLSDSTCDLSPELIERFGVGICPLQVNLGEESRWDGVDITPDDVYAWADKNKKTPTTSAPAPEYIRSFLAQYAKDYDLIVFTISGEMSSTYQVFCRTASEHFPDARITVIDSRNLSTGIGLQIIAAATLIEAGADYDTVVKRIRDIIPKVRAGFVVDNVLFLHKGGRCSAVAAYGATALKLHPTLAVVDGVIKVDKKVRGDIRPATLKYAKGLEEGILNAEEDFVFITHAGTSQEIIDDVHAYLDSLHHFKNVFVTRAGCVISAHCGYGTLGVLFISK